MRNFLKILSYFCPQKKIVMKYLLLFLLLYGLFSCTQSTQNAQNAQKPSETAALTIPDTADCEKFFSYEKIPDSVFARMKGRSFPENCTVARDSLRYLRILHYNIKGEVLSGEMVCNKKIAADLREIFLELFRKKYPIEKVRLIDDYGADDETSMSDNNSSCFCFRTVAGTTELSLHALGMAVDINTLYNPYYRVKNGKEIIQPQNAKPYCDRSKKFDYKIEKDDECCKVFKKHGFLWGGDWQAYKDYQHFYKK